MSGSGIQMRVFYITWSLGGPDVALRCLGGSGRAVRTLSTEWAGQGSEGAGCTRQVSKALASLCHSSLLP